MPVPDQDERRQYVRGWPMLSLAKQDVAQVLKAERPNAHGPMRHNGHRHGRIRGRLRQRARREDKCGQDVGERGRTGGEQSRRSHGGSPH